MIVHSIPVAEESLTEESKESVDKGRSDGKWRSKVMSQKSMSK